MGAGLTPESELTEQEVRQGFNRLRELHQEMMHRVHELKVEKKQLNVRIHNLEHENAILRKENEKLKAERERRAMKVDFKKKFFDSL